MSSRIPPIFRIREPADFDRIPFTEGLAQVEVPIGLLHHVEFRNAHRGEGTRLDAIRRSIRSKGYQPVDPIVARIGRLGRWVIVDGGHRLTAAEEISHEFWTNLFGDKVRSLYFVLFLTPDSWSRTTPPPNISPKDLRAGEAAASRDLWERASSRRQGIADKPAPPKRY